MIQGSEEWFEARRGKITSSKLSDVLAKGRGEPFGKTAFTYAFEIVAEIKTGRVHSKGSFIPTEWGNLYEAEARETYERTTFNKVRECGFVLCEDKIFANWFGGSPDGLVRSAGIIEIKCPFNPANHLKTLKNGIPKEHIPQIQGNLMSTGRQWCDFISYHPYFPEDERLFVERIEADSEYQEQVLKPRILLFIQLIKNILK